VLIGILPLYSHRNAEFLHNEVPGMKIPMDIRERMRLAQGAYIMPPFNKVELAVRVVEVLQ